jgi:hypothetical protein
MTWREFIILTISAVLWAVVYEVLTRTVSGDTLEIIKVSVCLLLIAIFTVASVLGLRKKEWGRALACAALVGIFTYVLVMSCIRILSWY